MPSTRRIILATVVGLVLAVVLAGSLVLFLAWRLDQLEDPSDSKRSSAAVETPRPRREQVQLAGLRAPEPSSQLLQRARALMDEARAASCGPYSLVTDVQDEDLIRSCQTLARSLDEVYQERYGLLTVLAGPPKGAVVIFADRSDFRRFASQSGRVRVGYAGYSSGSQSTVVLTAEHVQRDELLRTLAHELSHLVTRRVLGSGLPPWLSEALADGVGDSATAEGWLPLRGLRGVEGPARRLDLAYGEKMVPSLQQLLVQDRGDFDGATVSFDYEQSALFVRYLLQNEVLAVRFRGYLQRLARSETYDAEALRQALGRSWEELDRGLEDWLRHSMGVR